MFDISELVAALGSDPQGMLRNVLRIFHFLGLALGLGAATVMDIIILRLFLGQPLTHQTCDVFAVCATVVNRGLLLLWVTGIGFLLFYAAFEPVKLGNEKVWAKMAIVAVLSLNGVFIHKVILPFVMSQGGEMMLYGLSRLKQHLFLTSGVLSAVSWYGPLMIANISHLNFQVPAEQILIVYALVLICAWVVGHILLLMRNFRGLHLFERPRRHF